MADEVIDAPKGAAEQVSAPDLRETIVAAVAKQREEPEVVAADVPETEVEKAAKVIDGKGRTHDEKGRFAAKAESAEAEAAKPEAAAAPVDSKEAAPSADAAPSLRPPTSWSPTAKVAFEKLPPEVQQAVAKREEDVAKGFENYQRFKPIEKYDEMARQSGTTLDRALENYVDIENELSRDVVSGIARICQNKGIHPVALANQILARHGGSLQQGAAGETDPQQVRDGGHQPANIDLSPVMQKISALESFINQQQSATVQSEIQRFASDPKHTFFENVKADMGRLMNSGQAETMDEAYDKACWANQEIRALLIKQQTTSAPKAEDAVQRARAADKATGGAPSAGFTPSGPAIKAGASIRETIQAAVASQRGL